MSFCYKPASEERSLRFSSGDAEGRRERMQIEGKELRDTETDTEGRRGRMKIEGEAVKGICEETVAEGRR